MDLQNSNTTTTESENSESLLQWFREQMDLARPFMRRSMLQPRLVLREPVDISWSTLVTASLLMSLIVTLVGAVVTNIILAKTIGVVSYSLGSISAFGVSSLIVLYVAGSWFYLDHYSIKVQPREIAKVFVTAFIASHFLVLLGLPVALVPSPFLAIAPVISVLAIGYNLYLLDIGLRETLKIPTLHVRRLLLVFAVIAIVEVIQIVSSLRY